MIALMIGKPNLPANVEFLLVHYNTTSYGLEALSASLQQCAAWCNNIVVPTGDHVSCCYQSAYQDALYRILILLKKYTLVHTLVENYNI